ncbi:hypothetical protein BGZ70_002138 [Mortierella alpina]|uniref:FAD-binding domain-containing protein n=1 Tax=Mortierella alpina TaxID=64518 RepID=A0A9P6IUN4_MORAP|nr:hypothetical protein BGZ70_002138 [Mortierella alpina]
MIVGAGLAGLMMAYLLERIDVPYTVFERSAEVRPLGSVLSLNANILALFEQLGLLDEVLAISKPCTSLDLFDGSMQSIGSISSSGYQEVAGYPAVVFARPQLYDLLISKIPPKKIIMNKKILSLEQNTLGVMIRCADGSNHHGDILVGADGAYSGVRQGLYKNLTKKKLLPKSDNEDLDLGYVVMVGVTDPLDEDKYPELKDAHTHFRQVLGDKNIAWQSISVPGNKICWRLGAQLESEEARAQMLRNSEWGPEANEAMIQQFYDLPCPFGGKMGDMIDATPKERISKVYLEEKLFETWYHGRTVLIGDACHKMLPQAGQGAINAMQDAVILANCLYDMGEPNVTNIKAAFQQYYDLRYPHAKTQFANSKFMAKLMSGQKLSERIFRNLMFNYMPAFLRVRHYAKAASYQPQASFLPTIPPRGTGPVEPQMPSKRYAEELKQKEAGAPPELAVSNVMTEPVSLE